MRAVNQFDDYGNLILYSDESQYYNRVGYISREMIEGLLEHLKSGKLYNTYPRCIFSRREVALVIAYHYHSLIKYLKE